MKIVFLLAVFWIQRYVVIGASPNCCTSKNVGGLEYTLLRVEDTTQYNCLTNCVYEKVGEPVPGRAYCFGTGDLKVECTGEGDPIICDDELKTLHGSLSASNNRNDIDCCENGMTTNKTTCGNGTDCATVCGVIPTCAKVVNDPDEGKDYCSNSKTNTRDGRANNNYQMVIMKASETNGPDNSENDNFVGELLTTFLGWMTNSGFTHNVQCCEKGTTATNSTCGNGGTRCEDVCNKIITSAKFVDDFEGQNGCGNSDGVMVLVDGDDDDDESTRCSFCNGNVNTCYCGPNVGGTTPTKNDMTFICPGPDNSINFMSFGTNYWRRKCCKCKNFSKLTCCAICKSCQMYYNTNNNCTN